MGINDFKGVLIPKYWNPESARWKCDFEMASEEACLYKDICPD